MPHKLNAVMFKVCQTSVQLLTLRPLSERAGHHQSGVSNMVIMFHAGLSGGLQRHHIHQNSREVLQVQRQRYADLANRDIFQMSVTQTALHTPRLTAALVQIATNCMGRSVLVVPDHT